MTLTITLPADLERPLLARAATTGRDPEETLLLLLRAGIGAGPPRPPAAPRRLPPGVYPDDDSAGDEAAYRPVPFPVVGVVPARFVPAGRLAPAAVRDAE